MEKEVKVKTGELVLVDQVAVKEKVELVKSSDGGPALEMALGEIGKQSLKSATLTRDLMESSLSSSLPELENGSPLSKLLLDANEKTARLNPNNVQNSLWYKLIPFEGFRSSLTKKFISGIKDERKQLSEVFENLEIGKEVLLKKMIELDEQYKNLRKTDESLLRDIAVGEQIFSELEKVDSTALPAVEQQKYEMARSKVSRRVRDLETVRQAIQQFFVTINQTMRSQTLLNESIDSLRLVGPMVISNAIRIHQAISSQKAAAEAVEQVSGMISQTMKQNAEMVEGNAHTIAELYKRPVLALEDMREAFSKLENAVNITNKAMAEGTVSAREATAQLRAMSADFEPVVASLEEMREDLTVAEQSDTKKLTNEE